MKSSDDPKLPLHLLIYAIQTAITTSTCIADYLSWNDFSNSEKIELGKLYVPYLALCKWKKARLRHRNGITECLKQLCSWESICTED